MLSNFNTEKPLIIGIAGGSGSGKTALTKALQSEIGLDKSLLFQLDAYYRDLSHMPLEERDNVNFDHPDAMDLKLFAAHLIYLKESKPVKKPVYDFNTHTRFNYFENIEPKNVIITEGILLFFDKMIRECIDFRVFLDIETDTRFNRRIGRDVKERSRTPEAVKKQYYSTVETMHNEFVEPSKRYADLILTEADISNWISNIMSEFDSERLV